MKGIGFQLGCGVLATCGWLAAATGCADPGTDAKAAGGADEGQPAAADEARPAAATQPGTFLGPAKLTFASTTHDFGVMSETETREVSFEFTNTGGTILTISRITTTCGCTAASYAKGRYLPGESGTIDVVFDPTAPGWQQKYITVLSNAMPQRTAKLTITADVQPFIIFEPKMLILGEMEYGKPHLAQFSVSSPDRDFVVQSVTTGSPLVTARVLEGDGSRSAGLPRQERIELSISPDAPWGGLYTWLEVTLRGRPTPGADPITHSSRMRFGAQLFGELRGVPDQFRFGLRPGQAIESRLTLERPSGAPFRVLGMAITSPDIPDAKIRLETISANAYELILTGTAASQPTQHDGVVAVRTDVPGEEIIDIPIFGVVRNPTPQP